MRYIWIHIEWIINKYDGSMPLAHFLKNYFKQQPKLGSRDRKLLAELSYCWYRFAKAVSVTLGFEKRMQVCVFLGFTEIKHITTFFDESWIELYRTSFQEKIIFLKGLNISIDLSLLAPFSLTFSNGIDKQQWLQAMTSQNKLFLRIRGNQERIIFALKQNSIEYEQIDDNCIALKNGISLDNFLSPKDYVIQDASSQLTGSFFNPKKDEQWWDCCSGAGGKSLLLMDKNVSIKLTVSDVRKSILSNLSERFAIYGFKYPNMIEVDVSDELMLVKVLKEKQFDHIICDVPCSGSGTWFRTPEQLFHFEEESIENFAERQLKIASNVFRYLRKGGKMYYITCSVFQAENEEVVDKFISQNNAVLLKQQLINGIDKNADCLFIAVLEKH